MSTAWTFRPPAWAVIGTAVGVAVTAWLGTWQLRRGHAREALDAQYASAREAEPVELDRSTATRPNAQAIAARATGRYGAEQLLLDNQVNAQLPGYQVLTPLELADGALVLVNRGWVPQNPDRRVLPQAAIPEGIVNVRGLWRALPQPALRLETANCSGAGWPRVVEYPTTADLACLYPGRAVAPGMLLLSPDADHGFVRNWSQADVRFPPSRHYGYAAQWFAFGATLLVIFLKLNLKRRP